MAILAWVRFYNISEPAHIASTAIILPVIIIFIAFAIHFHRNLITVKCQHSTRGIVELERLAHDLESGQCTDDRNNHYTETQFNHLTNNTQNIPFSYNNQHNNLYNITKFNHLSYPEKNKLMLQNGVDAIFKPISPLSRNSQSLTQISLNRNNVIDEKVNELLNDNKEFRKTFENAKGTSSKNENTANANKNDPITMENNKNPLQIKKIESSQLIKKANSGRNTQTNNKFFSKFFNKKQPNSNTILNL